MVLKNILLCKCYVEILLYNNNDNIHKIYFDKITINTKYHIIIN